MHNRTTEDSPLLAGEAGMIRDWDDGGRQGSGRALLEGAREKSRRKSWHDGGGGGGDGGAALARRAVTDAFRRRWRVSAAVAGVVMFSMALAGLVAIFSTIQSQRAPASSGPSTLEQIKETVPVAPARELPPSTATPVTRRTPRSSRGEQGKLVPCIIYVRILYCCMYNTQRRAERGKRDGLVIPIYSVLIFVQIGDYHTATRTCITEREVDRIIPPRTHRIRQICLPLVACTH